MRSAHRAEVCDLGRFARQGLVVEFARLVGVEAKIELLLPAKAIALLVSHVESRQKIVRLPAGKSFVLSSLFNVTDY
jgi:hypothetical protein